jgi:hypothetical protein
MLMKKAYDAKSNALQIMKRDHSFKLPFEIYTEGIENEVL